MRTLYLPLISCLPLLACAALPESFSEEKADESATEVLVSLELGSCWATPGEGEGFFEPAEVICSLPGLGDDGFANMKAESDCLNFKEALTTDSLDESREFHLRLIDDDCDPFPVDISVSFVNSPIAARTQESILNWHTTIDGPLSFEDAKRASIDFAERDLEVQIALTEVRAARLTFEPTTIALPEGITSQERTDGEENAMLSFENETQNISLRPSDSGTSAFFLLRGALSENTDNALRPSDATLAGTLRLNGGPGTGEATPFALKAGTLYTLSDEGLTGSGE